ncbi:hypothetical protein K435DRAFT_801304 [Dendrothele bispora CBS 962.96]|uniref:Uncharacterized protein n=1 Tax=Dendrothele bispora (strain CBS 962.96) TaxID=1314807 RepID=A0A4S8LPZ5_DENBC|nr:hypothetical protein K435DRAFT_801301 [Dendrothele bispora CBS 962.96]THU91407.1 hypothetical protein K435DRAFT_801304 [Dendrothele bispora CBS 962.96]
MYRQICGNGTLKMPSKQMNPVIVWNYVRYYRKYNYRCVHSLDQGTGILALTDELLRDHGNIYYDIQYISKPVQSAKPSPEFLGDDMIRTESFQPWLFLSVRNLVPSTGSYKANGNA